MGYNLVVKKNYHNHIMNNGFISEATIYTPVLGEKLVYFTSGVQHEAIIWKRFGELNFLEYCRHPSNSGGFGKNFLFLNQVKNEESKFF